MITGFNSDITNYKNLWTESLDISNDNPKEVRWLAEEYRFYKKTPHPTYKEDSIVYRLNNDNLRVYKERKGIKFLACFGCSCTFGVGLPDNETWPYLLQEQVGSEVFSAINFGVVGCSIDYMARNVYTFLQEHTPHAIICYFPEIFRKEYFSANKKQMIHMALNMPLVRMPSEKEFESFCTLTNDYDSFFNFVKNFNFIKTLCRLKNIKFIWHTWSNFLLNIDLLVLKSFLGVDVEYIEKNGKLLDIQNTYNLLKPEDYARDGRHFGAKHNQILTSEFAKLLNN